MLDACWLCGLAPGWTLRSLVVLRNAGRLLFAVLSLCVPLSICRYPFTGAALHTSIIPWTGHDWKRTEREITLSQRVKNGMDSGSASIRLTQRREARQRRRAWHSPPPSTQLGLSLFRQSSFIFATVFHTFPYPSATGIASRAG